MRCQVRCTSRYSSADSFPFAIAERTSFRKISAPPPVRESTRPPSLRKTPPPPARERVQPGRLQFRQSLLDGFLGQPRQMQNLNRRKTFQLQPCIDRSQGLQHVRVITERQRRMQPADDVQFREA